MKGMSTVALVIIVVTAIIALLVILTIHSGASSIVETLKIKLYDLFCIGC